MDTDKFKNKYRITSSRLQTWDYASEGSYFITICTKDRTHYFGEIENQRMKFSPVGALADVLWYEIKHHAKNIDLGEFVVMPNHIHGILILNGNGGIDDIGRGRDKACLVSTSTNIITNNDKTIGQKRFQNQGKNTIHQLLVPINRR